MVLESTAFGAALVFGFRHGFDWDHLAALTDLTGSQQRTRRSIWLATLYVSGHAATVFVLGLIAIFFAASVPAAVDHAMEKLVGVSLIALAAWIMWTTVRMRRVPAPRSRWMVLIGASRRMLGRLRRPRVVVIEHSHGHTHGHALHRHGHSDGHELGVADGGPTGDPSRAAGGTATAVDHVHLHRHVVADATDPFMSYGAWSSLGIGVLHGIGAETPTQVLLFAAAAKATSTASSIGMLLCFLIGLAAANTAVAVVSALGLRAAGRRQVFVTVLSALTAASSLVLGTVLLAGRSDVLPAIFGV